MINFNNAEFELCVATNGPKEAANNKLSKANLSKVKETAAIVAQNTALNLETVDKICSIDTLQDIGSDPYWVSKPDVNVYKYVYEGTKRKGYAKIIVLR